MTMTTMTMMMTRAVTMRAQTMTKVRDTWIVEVLEEADVVPLRAVSESGTEAEVSGGGLLAVAGGGTAGRSG